MELLFGRLPNVAGYQGALRLQDELNRRDAQSTFAAERLCMKLMRDRPRELAPPTELSVNEFVLVHHNHPGAFTQSYMGNKPMSAAYRPQWSLPMLVTAVHSTTVEVERYFTDRKRFTVHQDHVRKFVRPKEPLLEASVRAYSKEQVAAQQEITAKRKRITDRTEANEEAVPLSSLRDEGRENSRDEPIAEAAVLDP